MWRPSTLQRWVPAARAGLARRGAVGFRTSAPACARVPVPIADVHAISSQAIRGLGYSEEDTAVLLDVMLWDALRGGAGLTDIVNGTLPAPPNQAGAAPSPEYETKLSARIDGSAQAGMLVMHHGVRHAVEKAKQHGVGLIGTRNVGSPSGALGYHLETIANAGLVGLIFAHSPGAAAGASPLGVSVPTARGAVVLDAATAAASVLGLPTTASDGLSGALATFDRSYKGSHLSVMVELLAGPLGACARAPVCT